MILTTAHLVNDHRTVMDTRYITRTEDFFESLEAARTYRIRP